MRSFLFGPLVRIIPIGLVFLGIQRRISAQYRPFDVVVDVMLALVVARGRRWWSGAWCAGRASCSG